MPGSLDFPDKSRKLMCHPAQHKKCSPHTIAFQYLQNLASALHNAALKAVPISPGDILLKSTHLEVIFHVDCKSVDDVGGIHNWRYLNKYF